MDQASRARATSKKWLDACHFCNRVQIQSPGLTSFCPLWLDNPLGWDAECMENRKDAHEKQPQGETCNDACETFLFPFPLRMHPVLTRKSVMIDSRLWDLEVLFWAFSIDYIIDPEVELNLQLLSAPWIAHSYTRSSQTSMSKPMTVFSLGGPESSWTTLLT